MTEPTPRPWWIDDDGFIAAGSGDDYVTVADVHCRPTAEAGDEMEANAEHIVKCVNAHDELRGLLGDCMDELMGIHDAYPEISRSWGDSSRLLRKVDALLEKLEVYEK